MLHGTAFGNNCQILTNIKKSQWVIITNLLFNTINQLDVRLFHTATTHIPILKYHHCCHAMLQHNGITYTILCSNKVY
jgi:hypothetical protein